MKYKLSNKLQSISAINDYHGLGKEAAMKLEAGESIELKKPPQIFIDNGQALQTLATIMFLTIIRMFLVSIRTYFLSFKLNKISRPSY